MGKMVDAMAKIWERDSTGQETVREHPHGGNTLDDLKNELAFQRQRPGSAAAGLEWAVAEIERLRAALEVCGASFISDPCTVAQGHSLLAAEFRRRMDIANQALTRG